MYKDPKGMLDIASHDSFVRESNLFLPKPAEEVLLFLYSTENQKFAEYMHGAHNINYYKFSEMHITDDYFMRFNDMKGPVGIMLFSDLFTDYVPKTYAGINVFIASLNEKFDIHCKIADAKSTKGRDKLSHYKDKNKDKPNE